MRTGLLVLVVSLSTVLAKAQISTPCNPTTYNEGYATYYILLDQGRKGHCSFDNNDLDHLYGAMYTPVYNTADACGMCVQVTGAAGTRIIEIVDECPTCTKIGDIDLGPQAFEEIVGPLSIGYSPISWLEVECPWNSSFVKVTTQGSNYWWAKVIISKHKTRLAKVEIEDGNQWITMSRQADNGWIGENLSEANNPHRLRITDVLGESIIVDNIDLSTSDNSFSGNSNFTGCMTTNITDNNQFDFISIYPNPASHIINLEGITGIDQINVKNAMGQLVQTINLQEVLFSYSINIEAFQQGIYILELKSHGTPKQFEVFIKTD